MSLHDIGEFGLIERLRRSVRQGAGVKIGIGDDCAALEVPAGELLLVTSDLLLENVHFRRDWTDLADLGAKSVAVNLSDIAAMGGTPRYLILGLGLPSTFTLGEVDRFLEGFLEEAAASGVSLVGGDTCRAEQFLSVSVTAHGTVPVSELVRRKGAHPGDLLYVSGELGDSGLALCQLTAGQKPEPAVAHRHFRPRARLALGRALASRGLATSMIDLSDGLLADLRHLLAGDRLGAELCLERMPVSPTFERVTAGITEWRNLIFNGGEDYELLFTVPEQRRDEIEKMTGEFDVRITQIGKVKQEAGVVEVLDASGDPVPVNSAGFTHF